MTDKEKNSIELDIEAKTEDEDFSEYEWEIEKSNIYILEED